MTRVSDQFVQHRSWDEKNCMGLRCLELTLVCQDTSKLHIRPFILRTCAKNFLHRSSNWLTGLEHWIFPGTFSYRPSSPIDHVPPLTSPLTKFPLWSKLSIDRVLLINGNPIWTEFTRIDTRLMATNRVNSHKLISLSTMSLVRNRTRKRKKNRKINVKMNTVENGLHIILLSLQVCNLVSSNRILTSGQGTTLQQPEKRSTFKKNFFFMP